MGACVVAGYNDVSVVGSENNVLLCSGLWVYVPLIWMLKFQGHQRRGVLSTMFTDSIVYHTCMFVIAYENIS